MTQPEATEAELWMTLHDAMDGNLSMSRRRKLITAYRAAVLRTAADALDDSETLRDLTDDHMRDVNATTNELRRMAEEDQ
ncbi:hypothetical protein [Streptomyces roseicoloratus]|uniref:hypothetical protein n=1 Tax=Streptomyces roseicoloratus TaxID=2508722 RepID=UPI001009A9AD|nr:hypothetical protein [Streptomyces roseicoloratus]